MDTPSVTPRDLVSAIRGATSRAGRTIAEVAEESGLSRTTMNRRLTGSTFRVDELIRIAAALDITLAEMVHDAELAASRRPRALADVRGVS